MQRHFQKELESLKTLLIKMGSLVEENFRNALQAVQHVDSERANAVIVADKRIDALELEIDNAILDLLALQQPVARDLRLIIASQKINNDLERISDHAVNIAQAALNLVHRSTALNEFPEINEMANHTRRMLKDALDSFILLDVSLARAVLLSDDRIDELNKNVTRHVIHLVKENPLLIEAALECSRVSRNIERVADLSTNIAEEVIFFAQARIVKHHADEVPDADKELH
ncbi:MAG: phosphate signaling complex protein PhoU [Bacteroidetes bacterium]|nr:phosphate signaling complex protein PhoU [Bacteroidota bacterium]